MEQNEQQSQEFAVIEAAPAPVQLSPQAIHVIKTNIAMCEQLVSEVLEKDIDWGLIPGLPQPNLWDPGAAKIMGAFNCYPKYTVLNRIEDDDLITFTFESALVSRQTQQTIATGVGACSTREVKYKYRWVPEEEAETLGFDPKTLKHKRSQWGDKFQIPNPERGELVNTIAKMAAKRADVDAAQSLPGVASTLRKLFQGRQVKGNGQNWKWFEAQLQTARTTHQKAREILKNYTQDPNFKSIKDDWVAQGRTLDEAWQIIKQALDRQKVGAAAPKTPPVKGEGPAGVATSKPKRDINTIKSIDDCMAACLADFNLTEPEVLSESNLSSRSEIVDTKGIYRAIAAVREQGA